MLFFQNIETPASDLPLAGGLSASVVMLASDLQLHIVSGSFPAAVAMLLCERRFSAKEIAGPWGHEIKGSMQ